MAVRDEAGFAYRIEEVSAGRLDASTTTPPGTFTRRAGDASGPSGSVRQSTPPTSTCRPRRTRASCSGSSRQRRDATGVDTVRGALLTRIETAARSERELLDLRGLAGRAGRRRAAAARRRRRRTSCTGCSTAMLADHRSLGRGRAPLTGSSDARRLGFPRAHPQRGAPVRDRPRARRGRVAAAARRGLAADLRPVLRRPGAVGAGGPRGLARGGPRAPDDRADGVLRGRRRTAHPPRPPVAARPGLPRPADRAREGPDLPRRHAGPRGGHPRRARAAARSR